MKHTKIVSTIGPATNTKKKIEQLVDAGVNVIRQNYSHVDHETHGEIFDRIRDVSEKTAVMADTKGPEIRLREVTEDTVLHDDRTVKLTTKETTGTEEKLSVNYDNFIENIAVGDEVRIDDGKLELQVINIEDGEAECNIIHGGPVSSRKAVNVPGKDVGLAAPTEKDVKDIEFAAEKGYDFVSLSFVKHAEDVENVREILEEHGSDMHIISKIEHAKAVENFDEILDASDGIMVARGDLGVELPPAELPMLQKEMIEKCNKAGKPVITATQMLESMTENPTATRAEISDVANAVMDGSDAVMLSGETAIGEYPVNTVEFMSDVIEEAESHIKEQTHHTVKDKPRNTREVITKNVWQASRDSDADYIVAHTTSGSTARNVSKHRPETPIIAFTDEEIVERQLQLAWGVRSYYEEFPEAVEGMMKASAKRMKTLGFADEGTEMVLSAGIPTSVTGTTNMMQIRKAEELL
ncbi:MAG: pyruvate kinase [Colwellia polaris]|jgi:pyruvate kinase